MISEKCQNPLCNSSLKNNSESNSVKVYHCPTCDKNFCVHCNNVVDKLGNHKTCIYCGEKLIEKKSTEIIPDENNIVLAVEKRLSMGERGLELMKAYCLKCMHEVCLPDLSVLPTTPCVKCGTICYVDNYSKKYEGSNNTFQPTDEINIKYLQGFFAEYKALRNRKASNPLLGEFELNNWLFKNILTIHVFQVSQIIRKDYPDDADIFENVHNHFK